MKRLILTFSAIFQLTLLAGGTGLSAQLLTPSYATRTNGLGLAISDGPGDLAFEGSWRQAFGGNTGELRIGLADTNDLSALIGGQLFVSLLVNGPIELLASGAAQALIGDGSAIGLGAGLPIVLWRTGGLALTPYFQPTLAFFSSNPGEEDDLSFSAELGTGLEISPRLSANAAIVLGDRSRLGFGLNWR